MDELYVLTTLCGLKVAQEKTLISSVIKCTCIDIVILSAQVVCTTCRIHWLIHRNFPVDWRACKCLEIFSSEYGATLKHCYAFKHYRWSFAWAKAGNRGKKTVLGGGGICYIYTLFYYKLIQRKHCGYEIKQTLGYERGSDWSSTFLWNHLKHSCEYCFDDFCSCHLLPAGLNFVFILGANSGQKQYDLHHLVPQGLCCSGRLCLTTHSAL